MTRRSWDLRALLRENVWKNPSKRRIFSYKNGRKSENLLSQLLRNLRVHLMVLETHRTECSNIAQKLKFGTQLFSGPTQPQLPSLVLLLLEVVAFLLSTYGQPTTTINYVYCTSPIFFESKCFCSYRGHATLTDERWTTTLGVSMPISIVIRHENSSEGAEIFRFRWLMWCLTIQP